jgi:hypothetical protein
VIHSLKRFVPAAVIALICLFLLPPVHAADSDALVEMDSSGAFYSGEWKKAQSVLAYNHEYKYALCNGTDTPTKVASFDSTVEGITASSTGTYSVYVHSVGKSSATTTAHYRIFDGLTQVGVCTVNQTSSTGEWTYCDTVQLTSGNPFSIRIGNDCEARKIVIADAVRLVKLYAGATGPQGPKGDTGPSATLDLTRTIASVSVPFGTAYVDTKVSCPDGYAMYNHIELCDWFGSGACGSGLTPFCQVVSFHEINIGGAAQYIQYHTVRTAVAAHLCLTGANATLVAFCMKAQ